VLAESVETPRSQNVRELSASGVKVRVVTLSPVSSSLIEGLRRP